MCFCLGSTGKYIMQTICLKSKELIISMVSPEKENESIMSPTIRLHGKTP
jgi:hypothetical protein